MKNLEQIKDSVRRLYELGLEKKKFDKYYNDVRNKEQLCISNFMFSNLKSNENSFDIKLDNGFEYYAEPKDLKVTKVRTKKIIWNIEKLKQKLSKDKQKQVVNKAYIIDDFEGLVNYLKTCGVNPKKFKKFISVDETINEVELNRLYEVGKIKKSEIDGCYDLKLGEPYIRITEQKHDTEL